MVNKGSGPDITGKKTEGTVKHKNNYAPPKENTPGPSLKEVNDKAREFMKKEVTLEAEAKKKAEAV